MYWKLQGKQSPAESALCDVDDYFPKPIFDLPTSICKAAKFIHDNLTDQMKDCVGVIILPTRILHLGWKHRRVRTVLDANKENTITLVEVEPGAWFLIHPSRERFFEDTKDKSWFLLHRDLLSKFDLY